MNLLDDFNMVEWKGEKERVASMIWGSKKDAWMQCATNFQVFDVNWRQKT